MTKRSPTLFTHAFMLHHYPTKWLEPHETPDGCLEVEVQVSVEGRTVLVMQLKLHMGIYGDRPQERDNGQGLVLAVKRKLRRIHGVNNVVLHPAAFSPIFRASGLNAQA